MYPNESAQDFHDGGLVSAPGGVVGDLFKGVDATKTHVELVVAQLSDGLGVPVGKLASLREFEGARGDSIDPAVQPEGAQPDETGQQSRSGGGHGAQPVPAA